MVAAVCVLLVAGMGVGFGWQPMPDGSPRYEYLVQVEPEMLETLAEGQTIPIFSDVPPGIGPIARVRVVVGRGELPKRRLITQLKPATDGSTGSSSGDGVVLTQYSEPGGRYAAPPAGAPQYGAPPSGAGPLGAASRTAVGASDPYTQAAPGAGGTWNSAEPPTSNPLRTAASGPAPSLGPETPWNPDGTVPRVADSTASGPVRRLGAGLQDATAPLTEGLDRFGNQIRTAADNIGDRTGQLIDELGRPLRPGGALRGGADPAAGAAAAAAPRAATDGGLGSAPVWNPGAAAAPPADAGWNNTAQGGGGNTGAPGGASGTGFAGDGTGGPVAPPLVPGSGFPDYATGSPYGATGSTASAGAAGAATVADPWANAADPLRPGSTGGVADGGAAPWSGAGTLPPAGAGSTVASGTGQGGPLLGDASGGRAINAGMLALPGTRPLDDVAAVGVGTVGAGGTGGNIFAPGTTGGTVFTGASGTRQTSTAPGGPLASEGWASRAGASTAAGQQAPATPASDARSKAAVIFAWVLLSGSAAGNIYLFWSYLDVRTKYRALVRKTARAVGSRFSPA